MRVFRTLIYFLIFIISIGFIGLVIVVTQPNKIVLVNKSAQDISSAQIIVGGESYYFKQVLAGRDSRLWYLYGGGDSSFDVTIELVNGDKISGGGGYMTSGYVFNETNVELLSDLTVLVSN